MVADFCTQWSLVICNTVDRIMVFTANCIVWDCAVCAEDFLVIWSEDVRNVMQVCVCVWFEVEVNCFHCEMNIS
jgi:hypothetical protein